MKQKSEYGIFQDTMILYCNNISATKNSKNPIQCSRTKHIDIRHYFIQELVEKEIILLEHVRSPMQLADILTKPLDATIFESLHVGLGVCRYNR